MQHTRTPIIKNGSKLKIAIILPTFNDKLGNELLDNTIAELKRLKVKTIQTFRVPGSLELIYATRKLIETKTFDAIIALGVVIRGETIHFDLVCNNTYAGLTKINAKGKIPIIFGVIATDTIKQAKDRIGKTKMNKGAQFAQAAVAMAHFPE